ncbi:hypothetical protein BB561_000070 [Smittium simulii]|uniref:Beta-flanking protein n=1 Tax=Smittium simulii TaxID=133385 RepID=A0A2T9Z0S7_9FUNG|nr:hypothetical protein BB561_000070 [Smittium simulii]
MDFGKLGNMASQAMSGNKKEDSPGGMDISNIASMAGGLMGGNKKEDSPGGMDMSSIASMAGGLMGGNKSENNNSDMISNAMKMATSMGGSEPSSSEIKDAHDQAYNKNSLADMSQKAMGMAAAYEIYNKVGGGSGDLSGIIAKILPEAMKLFNKSGASQSGGNDQLMMSAAQTAMKLFNK